MERRGRVKGTSKEVEGKGRHEEEGIRERNGENEMKRKRGTSKEVVKGKEGMKRKDEGDE
jgi:hypothetical protein